MDTTCIVCAKTFTANRSDAKTCSPSCRAKLRRMRIKAESNQANNPLELRNYSDLQKIKQFSPLAFDTLTRLHSLYGKDALEHALDAINELT